MSDTPRNDESPEFSDPTAPSDPYADSTGSHEEPRRSGDDTTAVETSQTQQVPQPPQAPSSSPAPGTGHQASPESPWASPAPGTGHQASPENPWASPAPGHQASPENPWASPAPGTGHQTPGQQAPGQGPFAAPTPGAGVPGAQQAGPQGPYAAPGAPQGYGTPQGYGSPQGPYAPGPAYGNGPAAAGYGANPYATPARTMSGNTIALLVVSGLLTVGGCGVGIIALVLAILAATKNDQPAEQAKFTKWGWWALGITVALAIIAVVGFVVLAAVGSNSYSGGGY